YICLLLLFFFSSRRRHTRCYRDWSSDVCSSDLVACTPESTRDGCPGCEFEAIRKSPAPIGAALPAALRPQSCRSFPQHTRRTHLGLQRIFRPRSNLADKIVIAKPKSFEERSELGQICVVKL